MKMTSRQALAATSALIVPTSHLPRALLHAGATVRNDIPSTPEAMFAALNTALNELRSQVGPEQLRAAVDPLITEREDRINASITNLEEALQAIQNTRDVQPGVIGDIRGNAEYSRVFADRFMRRGDELRETHADLVTSVNNALQIGVDADGGYLTPVEWDRSITEALQITTPLRQYADVMTISSGQGFSRLFAVGQPGSGWVGETAARPQTSTPTFVPLSFAFGEIYANPAITQRALDDPAINLEGWLNSQVRDEFSRQENVAFLSGDGTNKPRGLLNYVTGGTFAATHPLGAIEAVTSTAASGRGGLSPNGDAFLDTEYELEEERAGDAAWYMNRKTVNYLRKFKDTQGNYIWQPGMQAGEPATLNGSPIRTLPGMPAPVNGAFTAGQVIAMYGNMRATYLIIDRVGIRVLRDPYTNKPYVMFYTTKRVGGGVQNPEYMKALTAAA